MIWITGGNGQLGSCLKAQLPSGVQAIFSSRSDVNLLDLENVLRFIDLHGITHLINTAAYTAVDKAEEEVEAAELANVTMVEILAKACVQRDVTFLHVSTDFVYGGPADGLRSESESTQPIGVYGDTKRRGEMVLEASGAKYCILRTSWLYSDLGNNFYLTMKRLLGEGRDLKVVADQIGSPTSAYTLADFIYFILKDGELMPSLTNQIVNFSNEGTASWYDFAQAIRSLHNLPGKVSPCTTEEYPTKAKRPFFSKMALGKVRSTGFSNEHWIVELEKVAAKAD